MAEQRRDFRQEILNRLRGNVPGWDAAAGARDGFAELEEVELLHDTLDEHDLQQFYFALKSLIIDPNLSVEEYGVLVHFAYSKNLGQVENEIRTLRNMPSSEHPGLREIIDDYLAYRAERRQEARAPRA